MDPGRVVEQVVHDLALRGEKGSTLEEFWELGQSIIGQPLDQVFQSALWRWVTADKRVLVTNRDGMPVSVSDINNPESLKIQDEIVVKTVEEYLWLALTGQQQADSPIGVMAFKLLCAVCRARSAGMSAIELSRETGQDPRSIHGRIALLADQGLVVRYPVVQNKAHTHLIVHKQYAERYRTERTESGGHIDKFQLLKSILEWCKTGPNGMRLRQDLYFQLQFDKLPRGGPLLRNLLAKGEKGNYLVCMNVYESERPDSLYRCVKYLKDLDEEAEGRGDEEDEEEDEEDDEEENEEGPSIETPGYQPDVAKVVVASHAVADSGPIANLIYPIEHQIYDLVQNSGSFGLPAMSLYRNLTGAAYQKPISRLLDGLLATPTAKKKAIPNELSYLDFVRGIDFVARMKFYRYFTQITYAQFENRPANPCWGVFPPMPSSGASSLQMLSSKESTPLVGGAVIIETENSQQLSHFHGDKKLEGSRIILAAATPPAQGKGRGRPRKNAPKPVNEVPKIRKSQDQDKFDISKRNWKGGTPGFPRTRLPAALLSSFHSPSINEPTTDNKTHSVVSESPVSDVVTQTPEPTVPSLSIAATKREADILALMAADGGACIGGLALAKRLEKTESSASTIDRKTIEKSIARLVGSGKIKQIFVTAPMRGIFVTRYIIHDPAIDAGAEIITKLKADLSESIQNPPNATTPSKLPALVEGDISALSCGSTPRRFRVLASEVKTKVNRRKFGPKASDVAAGTANTNEDNAKITKISKPATPKRTRTGRLSSMLTTKKRKHEETREEDDQPVQIDPERLYRSIVVSRSLYPRGANIDWEMIVSDIPGLSASRARKRWPAIRDQYGGTKALSKATEQWERLFLAAYSRSEIELHDPEKEGFSLQPYVDFWIHHSETSLFDDVKALTTRADFEARYGTIRSQPVSNPLEGVFNLPTMVRVEELITNTSFSVPSGRSLNKVTGCVDFTSDEQLVRAVITSGDDLSPERAAGLLGELGEERVSEATEALVSNKVIHYTPRDPTKVLPGRNYTLSERVTNALSTKLDTSFSREAREFVKSLANSYLVPPTVEDSSIAAILELASTDGLHLRRLNHTTGRLISDYRSRMIEKQKLDFEVVVEVSRSLRKPPPLYSVYPVSKKSNEIYFWQYSESAFEAVVSKVLLLLVMRPYITLELIAANLKAVLRLNEVKVLVEWLRNTGRIDEKHGGYIANLYWFS
ncbi:Transcription factor tau subunit [Wickerhamiella sorbophila]|uniref:Transcription factor tau subunit n=1 Tax=Wickerhamiella sorbophila TaxID=45607 RepID=A0A2T0FKJ4_9ASCO|nr:Transcription factor tau subunit [Wickerhamiella sorbophila]PRT55495.1 Transcription factor tau subunit [Wickerhamiella sorbophila]